MKDPDRIPTDPSLQDLLSELARNVEGSLRADRMTRYLYSTDASMYRIDPLAVLIPRHRDDVQAAIEFAARHNLPVLPRGGGSSLAGQTVGAALVIDTSRHLDRILNIDREAKRVTVESGVILDVLNTVLEPTGLMVGPDPASSNRATIGGMVGNNATGTHSILYGSLVDHVHNARVLLADGTPTLLGPVDDETWTSRARGDSSVASVYRNLQALLARSNTTIDNDTPEHWRRSGGYRLERLLPGRERNLAHLLCGSEGTLAFATEITLSLVDRPVKSGLAIVHFGSRFEALEAVPTILRTDPSAVELLDRYGLDQCRKTPGYANKLDFVHGDPDALLITEYFGETESELRSKIERLETVLVRSRFKTEIVRALTPVAVANVWSVRKAALGLVLGIKGSYKPLAFIEDCSVPVEDLATYIRELERIFDQTGTRFTIYAHASAGCLHVRPYINTRDAGDVKKMAELSRNAMELVARFGGCWSSEHGEGLARSWLNKDFYGEDLYEVYRETKRIFDPDGIMNPGKIIDAPPMTENLRVGPDTHYVPLEENLDFTADHGISGAAELCTGIGACRKLSGGVMCPSFMVTRDERHSTRGRANALRAALTGELEPERLGDKELHDVMALCISCKGCKAECPSAVDMARLKFEWLHHYWKEHRVPLRERLVARLPSISKAAAGPAAPLVNFLMRSRISRWINRKLGLTDRRSLPPFARHPFKRNGSLPKSGRHRVVLFADTFCSFHEPEVATSAVTVLERFGFDVVVPRYACCGRTSISKGFVNRARDQARRVVELLSPYAEQDLPIVGVEPSCILSLRDEYPVLLPDDNRVGRISQNALTFEEFVAEHGSNQTAADLWNDDGASLLLHGHCHQKALVGVQPAVKALTLPPNTTVEVLDTSCCGMAGSFGYELEHYSYSIEMAELLLAPSVRSAPPDTVVVAAGTSCRAQIAHTTGRSALHPAQFLSRQLRI